MKTIYLNRVNLSFWQSEAKPSVVALGFFDGIHKGHCEVINTALQISKEKNLSLSVMSFFPHPKTVITNGKKQVNYLMPLSKKEEILREMGVDTFYIVDFDKEFASLTPEEFVSHYLINLGVVHAVAGFDYTYGNKGAGHMDRLKSDSGNLIEATKVEKLEFQGEKISSTCIRERLLKGKVDELPSFLGRPYEIGCEWDGYRLELKPYYLLPAPGKYDVVLKNDGSTIHTIMMVSEKAEGSSLTCMTEIPKSVEGSLIIEWNRCLPFKNVDEWYHLSSSFSKIQLVK